MARILHHTTVARDGYHNGFTDLQHWQSMYWVSYRKGSGHATMDGEAVISVSTDRVRFREAARIKVYGDNRDPKLFAISEGRLACTIPSWHGSYRSNALRTYITFSGDESFEKSLRRFLPLLYGIVSGENFRVNRKKTHFARRGARQGVTGLVVNDGPSVPRRYRRQLRAILHNARKTGLKAQNLTAHPHFAESLRGRIAFVRSTHPELADRLLAELDALR